MKKWNELEKKHKVMIGVGSALAVTAAGTGVAIASGGEQPAETTSMDKSSDEDGTKKDHSLKEVDEKEKQTDLDETGDDKEKQDKKEPDEDGKEEEKDKEEDETKETVEKKDDGTKVTTKSSVSSTPTATVKVEKSSNQTTSSSSSNTTANESTTQKTESKPASKPEPKITTKTTTSTESIAYKTIEKNDASLEKGQTKVTQNGKNGVRTITYKETYKDGKLVSKEETSSKVTTNPVDKIIAIGTKAPAPTKLSSADANSILGGSGMSNSGGYYSLDVGSYGQIVGTSVGSNGVSSIYFHPKGYMPYKYVDKNQIIDIYGKEEGEKIYQESQRIVKQIETAVRASANAVYGAGTTKANQLYNQIIGSQSAYEKSF